MPSQDLTVRIGADISRLQAGVNRAAASIRQFSARTERLGRSLQRNITLPILAIGGVSSKLALDFDTSMRKITGLVGVASEEVDRMRGSVLQLAGETARAPGELAEALFFVTSAGLRGAKALDVLESSAKASVAGLGETKTVADLVTSAINAYGAANLSASQATDILVGAVREGKAEATDLASSMGQVLPIASELEVGFDQVGAAIAAMTRTGTNAATASIQLRTILSSILRPSESAAKALSQMGTSAQGLRKQLREEGLVSVLGFLREQMEGNEEAMAQVFPNIRALSGALDIMGANAEENIAIFDRMKDTTGLNEDAFEAAQGPAFRLSQAFTKLKVEAVKLGQQLFPVVEMISKFVTGITNAISKLDTETRAKIIGIAILLGATGPLLIAISKLGKVVAGLAILITSKFGLIVIAFGSGVVAGQWLWDNWKKIGTGIEVVMNTIHLAAISMAEGMVRAVKWAVETIINSTPSGMLSKLFGFDQGEFSTELLGFESALESLAETGDKAFTDLARSIVKFGDMEFGGLGESLNNLKNRLLDLTGTRGILDNFFGMFEGVVSQGASSVREFSRSVKAEDFATDFKSKAEQLAGSMVQMVGTVQTNAQRLPEALRTMNETALFQLQELERGIRSALTSSIISFSEGVGQLIEAGGGFEGFLNLILSTIADFASQLGRIIVGIGVAMLAIRPESIFSNPFAAIAAGGALIALGGALKGLISRGPGGGTSSSGFSGGFEPSVRSEPSEVVFRIGNNELVGVLQSGNKIGGRIGRKVPLGG